jgi:CheY-like chemotaxis protein
VFRPDGEDALRLVRELRPAVIVLDLKLPKTSGVEILSGIHQDPALREIPVIVISGSMELLGDPVVRHSAVLLRKPFDIFVLKGLVDQALSGAHPTPPAE